ncbi:MAG: hypothetical protein MUO58_16420 [Anaerolineales bacterium]|nr:hypothetical protein [Anaerolineales bacterium]
MKSTPKNTRLVMAVLCVLVGLFLIAIAPRFIQTSLERVLVELLETINEQPRYASGITLFSFFYPLWWLLIASLSVLIIDAYTEYIRTKTLDYLYGAHPAAWLLLFLLFPTFNARLFNLGRTVSEAIRLEP